MGVRVEVTRLGGTDHDHEVRAAKNDIATARWMVAHAAKARDAAQVKLDAARQTLAQAEARLSELANRVN